jgi:hypothetical protein
MRIVQLHEFRDHAKGMDVDGGFRADRRGGG